MKTRLVASWVLSFVVLLITGGAQAQEQPGDVAAAAAALLDDPAARGKMSAMLEVKLLVLGGRMDELGGGTVGLSEVLAEPLLAGDVLVNDPGGDTGLSTTQSETTIRVSPVTGTICSAYNDSQHWAVGRTGFSGFSRSTDGGASFVDRGPFPTGGGGNSFGDPSLVWRAADGNFYYASLHSNGLGLWRSQDDCETFAFHSMIHTGSGDDKELMAVDNEPSSSYYGRFYVAWTDFSAGDRIYLTYSDDGLAWSSPIALSASGADVQGAWPTVAPNGEVYVGWVRWNPYPSGNIEIEIVRCVAGGASCSPVSKPMTGQVNPMDPSATSACGRPALHANAGDGIRYLPSPQLEVGPDGCLHVVYSYDPDGFGVGDTVNVYYRRSCDNGSSWGTEAQLNDDDTMTDQWFPTVSVSDTNRVVVTWYDRRLDPAGNYLFDYYLRLGEDGGTLWAPSTRLSDVSSAVPTLRPNFDPVVATCYHGDYDQQLQHGGAVYVLWSDDRNLQNGHPDPDVWFEKVIPCEAGLGTLEGTVATASGGEPIEGAEVSANGVTEHTDSIGFYQMALCAGNYDVGASAFGYLSETHYGVEVVHGAVTVVDFALDAAPRWTLHGTVTDSTTGWPLYAEVDYGPASVWTDPETGYYSVALPEGTYGLEASAWVDGYLPSTAAVDLLSNTIQDFHLDVDVAVCAAPGYEGGGYFEDFEADDGGYTHGGTYDEWEWGTPTAWPYGCQSGDRCWCTDLDSNYQNNADQWLYSPLIDLSAIPPGTPVQASWHQAIWIESSYWDAALAEVSINGGSYQVMWRHSGSTTQQDWDQKSHDISAAVGGTVRFRWRVITDSSVTYPGWCIDDVQIVGGVCAAPSDGGLVVGNVYDANLGDGIVDATVSVDVGGSATTGATPGDPDLDDGFYTLYVPTGVHDLTASDGDGYSTDTQTVEVADLGTVARDFELPAGWIAAAPPAVNVTVVPDGEAEVPVTLSNQGQLSASFSLIEHDSEPPPTTVLPGMPYEWMSVAYSDESEMPSSEGGKLDTVDSGSAMDAGPWSTASPIPTGPRFRAAGTSCDLLSYYVFGGADNYGGMLNESWKYEPATDTWTSLAPMPVALMNLSGTCIDGYIYLVGGYERGAARHTNNFQIYDTASDTWTRSTWPRVRTPMTAAWNGKLYAFGGNPGPSAETWVYDPSTASWSGPLAPLPAATNYGGAVAIGDYIYVIGGGAMNHVQRYDPALDAWDTSGPQLQDQRMSALTVVYGGLIYVVSGGGYGSIWDPWSSTEVYDPSLWPAGSWSYHDESVNTPAVGMAGGCADDRIWGAGGYLGYTSTDVNRSLDDDLTCSCGPSDISWLSVAPTSGTIPAGDEEVVSFIFDASGLPVGCCDPAWVELSNDTPYGRVPIPVTLVVSEEPLVVVSYGVEAGLPHNETLNGTPVRPVDAVDASTGELVFAAFPDVILEDIDAFHVMPDGSVVFSTSTDVTQGFGGLPAFKNGDLILWDGAVASLLFSEVVGFGNSLNNIDAFSILPNGNWLLSTDLPAMLGGLVFQNGDIVEYDPVQDVATLYMGLDEAAIFTGTPQSNADIDALDVTDDGSVIFSIRSNGIGRIGQDLTYGWPDVASTDLFLLDPVSGHAELFLDGAGLFDGVTRNLDAVSVSPRGAIPIPEPGGLLLLGCGIAGLLVIGRRRIWL